MGAYFADSCAAAATTTRSTFKIEDPSLGPGKADFRAPDEGFGLKGTPKPKIQGDPSPTKRKPYMWDAAVRFGSINIINDPTPYKFKWFGNSDGPKP